MSGSCNVTFFQGISYLGRTHGHVINILTRYFLYIKSILCAIEFKLVKATFTVLSKPVIISNYRFFCTNVFNENILNEIDRRKLREFFCERNAEQMLNTLFFQ